MGAFEQKINNSGSPDTVMGGYPDGKGPKCPKCKSTDTYATWRDMIWDETGCKFNTCGHEFIK